MQHTFFPTLKLILLKPWTFEDSWREKSIFHHINNIPCNHRRINSSKRNLFSVIWVGIHCFMPFFIQTCRCDSFWFEAPRGWSKKMKMFLHLMDSFLFNYQLLVQVEKEFSNPLFKKLLNSKQKSFYPKHFWNIPF